MTVFSKRNIVIPGPDGQKLCLKKDYVGPVPDWTGKSAYLKALVKDGKVIISRPKPPKKPEAKSGGEQK